MKIIEKKCPNCGVSFALSIDFFEDLKDEYFKYSNSFSNSDCTIILGILTSSKIFKNSFQNKKMYNKNVKGE